MIKVIYGDVLLLIDFCMNFFVLYTTSIILRRKVKWSCIGLGSLIGGVYSVAKVFISGNNVLDCIISFCVGILICYICFGAYRFLKTATVFFATAALLGGMMLGIYYFLGSYHRNIYGYAFEYAYSYLPIWLFIILAAISISISWAFAYFGRERSEKSEEDVFIEYMGKRIKVKTFLDTGNLVKEPISNKSVVLIVKEKAEELFGKEILKMMQTNDTEKLLRKKFRIITTCGIDGKKKISYGIVPEKIYTVSKNEKLELDAYVAVCDIERLFGDCDGIAHPAIFG